jgi:hypothetical protein
MSKRYSRACRGHEYGVLRRVAGYVRGMIVEVAAVAVLCAAALLLMYLVKAIAA